ncbi:MAG: AAA family ATPase [Patescibacteria group bacterium]
MSKSQNKIVALVGMCGAGKSEVANYFIKNGYAYLRFGQITLDEIKRRGLEPKEENERMIREELRKKYGMGAYAILNIPKIDKALKNSNVVIDGLYSWSEYKILKEKYKKRLIVVAVYASPKTRYARLKKRGEKHKKDPNIKYRSLSFEEAKARDYAEIENIEKAGPIAMADYTIINEGTLKDLYKNTEEIFNKINFKR